MLRRYEKKDIDGIINIENTVLGSSLGYDYYLKDLTNDLAYHYVYIIDDKIIGFISTICDGYSLEILNFAIIKEYQNQGYGKKILSSILNDFSARGVVNMILEVRKSNEKAIKLYEKLGFRTIRIRKNYYKDLEDALFMQKTNDEPLDKDFLV